MAGVNHFGHGFTSPEHPWTFRRRVCYFPEAVSRNPTRHAMREPRSPSKETCTMDVAARRGAPARLRCCGSIAVLLMLLVGDLGARPFTAPGEQEYSIEVWEGQDGLPENSATAIVQTRAGYIWFGTFNGLVRFDGHRFRVFDSLTSPSLPSAAVVNLHVDAHDRLWVSTDAGLVRFADGQSVTFTTNNGWAGDYVRTFAETAGQLVATTFDGHLLDLATGEPRALPLPPGMGGSGLVAALEDDGTLWLAQPPLLLSCRREGRWETPRCRTEPPLQGRIYGLAPSRNGGLWLITDQALVQVRRDRIQTIRPHGGGGSRSLWSLYEDRHTNIWISTYQHGLWRVAPDTSIRQFGRGRGLTYDSVRAVFQDRADNLWVGTSGGGIHRFRNRRFQVFGDDVGLPNAVVRTVHPLGTNALLVGTYGGGIARITEDTVEPMLNTSARGQPGIYINSILVDRAGTQWIGTADRGLFEVRAGTTNHHQPERLGSPAVYALAEDPGGTLWIGTGSGVASVRDGSLRLVPLGNNLRTGAVRAIAIDPRPGTTWFSLERQGLVRLETNTAVAVVAQDSDVAKALADIRAIHVLDDGSLWLGTAQGGLCRYRQGRFTLVNRDRGFPSRAVASLLPDQEGRLWIGTRQGLLRVALEDLGAAADNPSHQLRCERFDELDGLASIEAASVCQPAAARDPQGRFWFATLRGVARYRPETTGFGGSPPASRIASVRLDDRVVYDDLDPAGSSWPRTLQIPPGDHQLRIELAALDFSDLGKTRMQSRLEPRETQWSDEEDLVFERKDLAPGRYTLRFRTVTGSQIRELPDATLGLVAQPYFHQTWLFRLIALGGSAVGAGLLMSRFSHVRLRRRLERLEHQAAIAMAQSRLAAILENTSDLVAFADAQRRPLYVNRAGRQLLLIGEHDDVTKLAAADMYPAWVNELILREGLPTALREGVWRGQTAVRRTDGHEVPVSQVIIAHRKPDGSLDFTSTIIRDMTALQEAQAALADSEARFRSLFERCPMGIHLYTLQAGDQLVFTAANPAADHILGIDNQRFIGLTLEEAFPPLAQTELPAAYRKAAAGTPWHSYQVDYQHGQIRGTFEVYAFAAGPNRVAVMFLEITAREQAELALRESEERFRQLAENIREVFWLAEWPSHAFVYASPAFESLWGFPVTNLYAESSRWRQAIHPEDAAQAEASFHRHIEQGEYQIEYRLVRPDGTLRWVRDRGFAIRNAEGSVYRIAGVAEDITERRRAEALEDALRQLAEQLSAATTLRELGQILARCCRALFDHEAFLLNVVEADSGVPTGLYAEDTPPGRTQPVEVACDAPQVTGELLETLRPGKPLLVAQREPGTLPRFSAFGFREREARSLLFAGIVRDGRCAGLISVQSYTPGRYDTRDGDLLQVVADQCAATLARLQTESHLRQLNQELESKVRERTDELQRIVNLMANREIRMAELKAEISRLTTATPPPDAAS